MGMFASFIPMIASAAGGAISADAQQSAGNYNSGMRAAEGRAAEQQSLTAEATQRRAGREFLGRESAAIGQAGIGYGGSSAGVMDQSAVNAELDALNVRYKGQFTKYGYDAESQLAKYQAKVGAGAAILKGLSSAYAQAPSSINLGS